ncbi:hypothetical protein FGD71_027505 [Streptomyces sporangiiformans]|uniref:Uncharacterized protein n=1 Tax=Streptomyces sporangiiformans TaxID=2315329 RepID=A0A505DEI3_9ACTN|nr:hypothetical protein FGD71_027505 [Streptomyces sporangiiformans]
MYFTGRDLRRRVEPGAITLTVAQSAGDPGSSGTPPPAAVISFPFTHPTVVNVTLGMRTPEQVRPDGEFYCGHRPAPGRYGHAVRS